MQTDLADSPLASTVDHPSEHILEAYCPHCEHEVDAICPSCRSTVESSGADESAGPISNAEFHRRLLQWIVSKKNSRVAIYCFMIATGSGDADGLSMTVISRRFGISKAAISKHCRDAVETFGIMPSRYMRTEENAAKFRLSNRRPVKVGL